MSNDLKLSASADPVLEQVQNRTTRAFVIVLLIAVLAQAGAIVWLAQGKADKPAPGAVIEDEARLGVIEVRLRELETSLQGIADLRLRLDDIERCLKIGASQRLPIGGAGDPVFEGCPGRWP